MIDGAFTAARVAHFAATMLLQGCLVVQFLLAYRVLMADAKRDRFVQQFFDVTAAAAWIVAIASAAAWLLLLSAELADSSVYEALSDGTTWTLLTQTQFGWAWIARALGFVLLAVVLPIANRSSVAKLSAIVFALALSGSLAWSGHAAATPGTAGALHLGADVLHLIASGFWLGGLLPFAMLLAARPDAAADLTRRFSSLATLSVLILLPTGIVNGWMILPSINALTGTLYGELLLAKIVAFLLMLAFAGVNRFVLTPQLASPHSENARTRLIIHSGCEIVLGLAILALVGVLGTLTPKPDDDSMHGRDHAELRALVPAAKEAQRHSPPQHRPDRENCKTASDGRRARWPDFGDAVAGESRVARSYPRGRPGPCPHRFGLSTACWSHVSATTIYKSAEGVGSLVSTGGWLEGPRSGRSSIAIRSARPQAPTKAQAANT